MTKTYQFTLLLDNVRTDNPRLEDSLFEAGCDDALISSKAGAVYLDFDREEKSLEQAIISAINDVESSSVDATVVSAEPEHLVNLSDIAERLSLSRQAVSLFVLGKRGNGDFPIPTLKINSKSTLWKWSSVAEWFYKQGKIDSHQIIDDARTIENINFVLNNRYKQQADHRAKITASLHKKHIT